MGKIKMSDEKKLKVSLILLIVSAVALGIAIYLLSASFSGTIDVKVGTIVAIPFLGIYATAATVSFWLNMSYRKHHSEPGALSTALLVLACILFLPHIITTIFVVVLGLFGLANEANKITAKDKEGKEYTLKPTYEGSNNYKDQDGEEWKTKDGGQTFEHIVTKATVKDELGNEYELRADFAGSTNFMDQHGDKWTTYDEGKTFERWGSKK